MGKQRWSAMLRPLAVPTTDRYLQISESIRASLKPVSAKVAGSAGWKPSSERIADKRFNGFSATAALVIVFTLPRVAAPGVFGPLERPFFPLGRGPGALLRG